ncbi:hypothetical protein AAY81_03845 [Denitrobacterium detoxificans]|uniref:Energy-coupling factor transport system permease protein n=1 Tax=Denitrobacterium detoxificans TaxID=79604 RepID=A0A172RXG7_9ACTN|nr:energy-coupling factor transporter transmembrane component T [Denitrobacterium detoxificans]ANE22402.1 hypothetical protein AAY81_03845 [Denitrobacterium detoxificans]SEP02858.1 energy-coupling factor transport system permease protein [Denitrobacterium detoxificans]
MTSEDRKRQGLLDPRTKLLIIITLAIVLLTGGYNGAMIYVRPILAVLPMGLLLMERKLNIALGYAVAFIAAELLQMYVAPLTSGAWTVFILLLSGIMLRLAPGVAAFYYLVTTTTVGDLVAGLEKIHLPQTIVIPLSVMFRFFPTLAEENRAIGAAMRMRGIRLGKTGVAAAFEYRLIPLMMSSIRIGEELSAAALTRGLGAPVHRTTISEIGFRVTDIFCILICLACFIAYVCSELHLL